MPRPGPERAVSERWIDELAALRSEGPTQRFPVRARLVTRREPRRRGDPFFWLEVVVVVLSVPVRASLMPVVAGIFGRWTKPRRDPVHTEVGLYAPDVGPGDLPLVVVDFPIRIAALLEAHHDHVGVRGALAPGHGVVLVLANGEMVPCQYPAERRLRSAPTGPGRGVWANVRTCDCT